MKGMRQGSTCVSTDGLSHFMPTEYMTTLFFSMMALVSPAIQQQPVDLSYVDSVSAPDACTWHCTHISLNVYASARVLLGELLEREGRPELAIVFAQAELNVRHAHATCPAAILTESLSAVQEYRSHSMPLKARASRLLGRCHAALGDHTLSCAALDAAVEGTRTGELLVSGLARAFAFWEPRHAF